MGCVYAIGDRDGFVKIGWSASPKLRLIKVRSDTPLPCELLGIVAATRANEAELHAHFKPWHVQGEWYRCEGDVRAFVDALPALDKPLRQMKPGNTLRQYRVENGLRLQQLADQLNISKGNLSRLERGKCWPSLKLAQRIVDVTEGKVMPNDFLEAFIETRQAEAAE